MNRVAGGGILLRTLGLLCAVLVVMLADTSEAQLPRTGPPIDSRCNNPGSCSAFEACNTADPTCAGQGVCAQLAEGGGFCVNGSTSCGGLAACSTSDECPADSFCALNSCCGPGVCVPLTALCGEVISNQPVPLLSFGALVAMTTILLGVGGAGLRYRKRLSA